MRDTHNHTKFHMIVLFLGGGVCITLNGCEFCLLTPSAIGALSPNVYLRDGVRKFVISFPLDPVLVITIENIQYRTKVSK